MTTRAYPGDRIYFVRDLEFVPSKGGKTYTGWVRECERLRNGRLGTLLLPVGQTVKLMKPAQSQVRGRS